MIVLGPVKDDGTAFEGIRVVGIAQVALAELVTDNTGLHDCAVEEVAFEVDETGFGFHRIGNRTNDVVVLYGRSCTVFGNGLAVRGQSVRMRQKPGFQKLIDQIVKPLKFEFHCVVKVGSLVVVEPT